MECLALFDGIAADGPAVVVQSDKAVSETLLADRIECAADGFAEARLATAERLLEGTESVVAVVTVKDTVPAVDDAGDEVAVLVGIGHALSVDDTLSGCAEVAPDGIQSFFNACNLVDGDRCSGIALDAADALALLVVAAEALGEDLGGYQHTIDVEYGREFVYHCMGVRPCCWR